MKLTIDELRRCHLRTTLYTDGAKGSAQQCGHVTEHPRIYWTWVRRDRRDHGIRVFQVGDQTFDDGQWQAIVDAYNALQPPNERQAS